MFRGGQPNPYDDIVSKTTDENLTGENWELIITLCDKVQDEGEGGARNVIAAVLKRLAHRNPNVQLYTLSLAESLSKNCTVELHRELASKAFTQALEKLITDRTTHEKVRRRALGLIELWAHEFENDPTLGIMEECYSGLKAKNYKFEQPAEAPPPSVDDEVRRKEEEEIQRVLELSVQDKGGRSQWEQYSLASSSGASGSGSNLPGPSIPAASPTAAAEKHFNPPPASSGYVPASSVPPQAYTPTAEPAVEPHYQPQHQHQHQQAYSQTSIPDAPSPTPSTTNLVSRVRALHTFEPTEAGELAFDKGDIIKVVDRGYKDWWRGQLRGRTGIFPVNYVEALPEPTPSEIAKEAEQEAHVFSQAVDVDRLLTALRAMDPAKDNLADNEEIQELYRSCMALRPKIVKLIDKYSQKRADLVSMNESFVKARTIFDTMMEESLARHSQMYGNEYNRPPYQQHQSRPMSAGPQQGYGWNPNPGYEPQPAYGAYPGAGPYPGPEYSQPPYPGPPHGPEYAQSPGMYGPPQGPNGYQPPPQHAPSYQQQQPPQSQPPAQTPGGYQPQLPPAQGPAPNAYPAQPAQVQPVPQPQPQQSPTFGVYPIQPPAQAQGAPGPYPASQPPQAQGAPGPYPGSQPPQAQNSNTYLPVSPGPDAKAQSPSQQQAPGYQPPQQGYADPNASQPPAQGYQSQPGYADPNASQSPAPYSAGGGYPAQGGSLPGYGGPAGGYGGRESVSPVQGLGQQPQGPAPGGVQGQGQTVPQHRASLSQEYFPVQSQQPVQQQQQPQPVQQQAQPVVQQQQQAQPVVQQTQPVVQQAQPQPQPQQQTQAQEPAPSPQSGPPYIYDPNTHYSDSNVQAWAQYYAQGGLDPTGAVYFISVPGVKEATPAPAPTPLALGRTASASVGRKATLSQRQNSVPVGGVQQQQHQGSFDEELANPYDTLGGNGGAELEREDSLKNPYETYGVGAGGRAPGYGASPY